MPGAWGQEVPLGQGQVNMAKFVEALKAAGFKGTLAIEREVGDQQARIRDIALGVEVLRKLVK